MQALQILLQDSAWSSGALSASLFPKLLRAALVPVALPQFVALRWLQARAHVLRERLLDAATGVVIGQETLSEGTEKKLTPEEQNRLTLADQLVEMGVGARDLCVTALLLNRDSVERAFDWLTGPQAQAYVGGGGLNEVGETNPRWGAARDLGLVVGMHPKLCYHALEMHSDNRDLATAWLMDHGALYATSESILNDVKKDSAIAVRSQSKLLSNDAVVDDVGASGPLMMRGGSGGGGRGGGGDQESKATDQQVAVV